MTNLVLVYHGNVCSTPMVDYARALENVVVPIREDLDFYQVNEREPDASFVELATECLSLLFQRKTNEYLRWEDTVRFRGSVEIPSKEDVPHLFLKWRLPPNHLSDLDLFAPIFEEAEAVPFTILRRSVAAQAIKVILSEKNYGNKHPQFAARAGVMSDEDYHEYMEQQKAVKITLDEDDIAEVIKFARSSFNVNRRIARKYADFIPAKELPAVISEDVFDPDIKVATYNRVLSQLLGEPVAIGEQPKSEYRKSGLNIENCANLEDVLNLPELSEIEKQHEDLLAAHNVISS